MVGENRWCASFSNTAQIPLCGYTIIYEIVDRKLGTVFCGCSKCSVQEWALEVIDTAP